MCPTVGSGEGGGSYVRGTPVGARPAGGVQVPARAPRLPAPERVRTQVLRPHGIPLSSKYDPYKAGKSRFWP
jgi:hypothetical protein